MHCLRWMILAAALAATPSWASAEDKPKPDKPEVDRKSVDQCARVAAEVRNEAYGYTHVVVLRNGCNKAVVCEVWTDVDPTPRTTLRAAPGATAEAITRRGSPAREVQAESICRYD